MAKEEKFSKWGYVFHEEGADAPAAEFLKGLSANVRQRIFDTLDAVLLTKKPPRAYLPNRWHSMKEVGGLDMGDYFEARDQHDGVNYRLFCRFDSAAQTSKLGAPVLVLLSGASKAVRTAMDSVAYSTAKAYWSRYNQSERRCGAVSYPPAKLPPSPPTQA